MVTDTHSDKKRVLVAGATGYLGRHVVRALHQSGHTVKALARDAKSLQDLGDCCHEVFEGQATRKDTLAGLCDDVDVVFSSIGIRSFKRRPTVWEVDYQANMNVLQLAKEANVEHFLFVSAYKADEFRQRGVSVARAREAVSDAVRDSGMRWTILRPTGFFNDMKELFDMAKKGTGWVFNGGSTRLNPIHGADLADVTVRAIADEACWNTSIDCGGPDVFTHRQILEMAFDVLKKPAKIRSIPAGLLTPIRWLVRPFNGNLAGFLHAIKLVTTTDMAAQETGTHHLRDFFETLALAGVGEDQK